MPSTTPGRFFSCSERVLQIVRTEREAFANRHRRGSVVQSCDPELHLVTYVMNCPSRSRERDYRDGHQQRPFVPASRP